MLSLSIEFTTPMAMNMPSMSMLVKTIVTMEELFQLRSLHMMATRRRGGLRVTNLYLSLVSFLVMCCRYMLQGRPLLQGRCRQ